VTTDQPVPHLPDAPPHGTLRGWAMGCRCLFCKAAKTASMDTDSEAGPPREERPNR
jgi:hypothetical protein